MFPYMVNDCGEVNFDVGVVDFAYYCMKIRF